MDYNDYDRFVNNLRNENIDRGLYLLRLYEFLNDYSEQKIGKEIYHELISCEHSFDSDKYMDILKLNRTKLDDYSGNVLFQKWIRIILLSTLSSEDRRIVEGIPIVFIPEYPFIEAFITNTKYGPFICFSHAYNMILLELFYTLVCVKKEEPIYNLGTQLTTEDAAKRVIELISFLFRNCKEPVPKKLQLDYQHIHFSDQFNNLVHLFTLGHEYAHFILGHLDINNEKEKSKFDLKSVNIDLIKREFNQEIDADKYAIEILTSENAEFNYAILLNGIIAFFEFCILCHTIRNTSKSYIQTLRERLGKSIQLITADIKYVPLFEEIIKVMTMAQNKHS